MKRMLKNVMICLFLAAVFWCWSLFTDRKAVSEQLIRMHVVANSDSQLDQEIKLQVRDAVLKTIGRDLAKITDVDEAKAYLLEKLPVIETAANEVLEKAGYSERVITNLCKEFYNTKAYDTFYLPAGIYDSLRIIIGRGEGHNWWCVAFPSLCLPVTTEDFQEIAVSAGFSKTLTGALVKKPPYQLRFFLLDALGNFEGRFLRE